MMTENTNTFKNSSKRIVRRGFTLIEILIVVVILGVLAALVTGRLLDYLRNNSQENLQIVKLYLMINCRRNCD